MEHDKNNNSDSNEKRPAHKHPHCSPTGCLSFDRMFSTSPTRTVGSVPKKMEVIPESDEERKP